jgi:hypothetical protein
MARAWDPDLGRKDKMNNGTAATYIELEDCNVQEALNPEPLQKARQEERRKALNLEVLYKRVDWTKLDSVMALHCLSMLVQEVPSLAEHQDFVRLRFETAMAIHRMKRGRKTKLHPLATSDLNEGNTEQNARVLYDLLVNQLNLPKEEVERLLVIVGGDQSTVEKLRTLKKFLADCTHGYHRYGWVLPLIQLWHMGWADLERILKTHWGLADDLSGFCATNILLGRKVKNTERPDYYPAQHLVFDNLKAEVLDCWRFVKFQTEIHDIKLRLYHGITRIKLNITDLNEHFRLHATPVEDLLADAQAICQQYISASAAEDALHPNPWSHAKFPIGDKWTRPMPPVDTSKPQPTEPTEPFTGDQVLANTCRRMKDSMLHYEFQCAISDGDIGRAMNVMAVGLFPSCILHTMFTSTCLGLGLYIHWFGQEQVLK